MKRSLLFLMLILIALRFGMALCSDSQVDINSASAVDLDKIVYVGPATAENIIAYRESQRFESVNDLIKVSGIGETKLQAIKTQGLACVSNQTNEIKQENTTIERNQTNQEIINDTNDHEESNNAEENRIKKEDGLEAKPENLNTESIINLNKDEKIETYKSKDEKIRENLLIGFCVFLVIIIVFLLIRK